MNSPCDCRPAGTTPAPAPVSDMIIDLGVVHEPGTLWVCQHGRVWKAHPGQRMTYLLPLGRFGAWRYRRRVKGREGWVKP